MTSVEIEPRITTGVVEHITKPEPRSLGRVLIQCRDQPGIVSAVSRVLTDFGANITSLDQYSTDPSGGQFFQRTEFHLENLNARRTDLDKELGDRIRDVYDAQVTLSRVAYRKRVAIFVSKTDHCLLDLLWRHRSGELPVDIVMVVSNHSDLADDVHYFGIPFMHVPVDPKDKTVAENRHLDLLRDNVDLIVLARYMQIISERFLNEVNVPVINIHHSFLPAFIGAAPYRKAKERGVKMVGATAHYVTAELDQGPIIEQDVIRVDHSHSTQELMRKGAEVERQVLTRAVSWHCEDKVMRYGNLTVVI
ncbi:formyltetrahydrofolate deformylase (plasmid) [Rhodococcus erythropolis R138]|uniref:formyltetrahydrofolate deformylase n=1 Tax=Rhodococcus erythropolis TaxID=1833 RepID=UPI0007391DC8|nr:formyltetrahydrofolate deformylase [Rhodococcus erythropolis]ALU73458.1 formyltetrahydrofolate deformylase [Rhodococcus erythropolis R138]